MTKEMQDRILALSQRTSFPKTLDIAASMMRKIVTDEEPMAKFPKLNAGLAKLSLEARTKLIELAELIIADADAAEAAKAAAAAEAATEDAAPMPAEGAAG